MKLNVNVLKFVIAFWLYPLTNFAQSPNFTGTWVLNFEKSSIEDRNDKLTRQIFLIKQNGDDFSLKIQHIYGNKTRKIGFRMLADGKTRRVKLLFKGKLEQKENGLQATMWRKYYFNQVNYRFGKDQNELIADETYQGIPKNHHSIWVFDRQFTGSSAER
jgi:hypothetical protein